MRRLCEEGIAAMDRPLGMLRLVVRDGSQGGEPLTLLPPIAFVQLRSPHRTESSSPHCDRPSAAARATAAEPRTEPIQQKRGQKNEVNGDCTYRMTSGGTCGCSPRLGAERLALSPCRAPSPPSCTIVPVTVISVSVLQVVVPVEAVAPVATSGSGIAMFAVVSGLVTHLSQSRFSHASHHSG